MAEGTLEKPLSLAEQYSILDTEKTTQIEVSAKETTRNYSPAETCVSEVVAEKFDQIVKQGTSSVREASSDVPEEQETETQEVEEKPEIKIETAPADFRFPTTNQTRHCFTRYVEYHRCVAAKGEDALECNKFAKYYRSLCPSEWVDRWNEQRANGTFPGPL